MNIRDVGRIVAWATVLSLAGFTSLAVVAITRVLQGEGWIVTRGWFGLAGLACMTALAIAPWWALAAAMIQSDRRRAASLRA